MSIVESVSQKLARTLTADGRVQTAFGGCTKPQAEVVRLPPSPARLASEVFPRARLLLDGARDPVVCPPLQRRDLRASAFASFPGESTACLERGGRDGAVVIAPARRRDEIGALFVPAPPPPPPPAPRPAEPLARDNGWP